MDKHSGGISKGADASPQPKQTNMGTILYHRVLRNILRLYRKRGPPKCHNSSGGGDSFMRLAVSGCLGTSWMLVIICDKNEKLINRVKHVDYSQKLNVVFE